MTATKEPKDRKTLYTVLATVGGLLTAVVTFAAKLLEMSPDKVIVTKDVFLAIVRALETLLPMVGYGAGGVLVWYLIRAHREDRREWLAQLKQQATDHADERSKWQDISQGITDIGDRLEGMIKAMQAMLQEVLRNRTDSGKHAILAIEPTNPASPKYHTPPTPITQPRMEKPANLESIG